MSEIAVREPDALEQQPTGTLFRSDNPVEIIASASEIADELAKVVKKQKLTTKIQGKDHVRVEGWTLLGSLLGVFPVLVWSREMDGGWEARVEARTLAGAVVGAAEAMCVRKESLWRNRDDYALRSMAQTRATSKALRQPLGFVMTLAGFEATPAEEMTFAEAEVVDAPIVRDVPAALAPDDDDDPVRATLTGNLLKLAEELGARDTTANAVAANRKRNTLDAHKDWLLIQVEKAAAKVEEKADEQIEFAPEVKA